MYYIMKYKNFYGSYKNITYESNIHIYSHICKIICIYYKKTRKTSSAFEFKPISLDSHGK